MNDIAKGIKVGIQGVEDSFSYHAAQTVFGKDVDIVCAEDFYKCFETLANKETTHLVVPIENSTFGSIYENYDNITRYNVAIVGEVYAKISLGLLGLKGASLSSIRRVYSHPVALMQINNFKEQHPDIEFISYHDTAQSVEHILELQDPTNAACAGNYIQREGLDRIANHIEDNTTNYTRFLVLSKDSTVIHHSHAQDVYKTSIVFCLGEEAGSLAKILMAFAEQDITLTHIQSRPLIGRHWEYRFYVDAVAHKDDAAFKAAVEKAEPLLHKCELTILGSYHYGENLYIE